MEILVPILLIVMVVVINFANGTFDRNGTAPPLSPNDEDDDTLGYAVNVGGAPMMGDVDIDGNPFGSDYSMDYGFDDDTGGMFDD